MLRRIRISAPITWLLDWHVRLMLRHHGLPDLPEVRRALRAWWRLGWTFGAAPSTRELRALHEEAVEAIFRAQQDEDAR